MRKPLTNNFFEYENVKVTRTLKQMQMKSLTNLRVAATPWDTSQIEKLMRYEQHPYSNHPWRLSCVA